MPSSAYHWAFLAQPYPLPETLIGKDPVFYLEHTLKSWAKPRDLSPFSPEALAHYRALLQDPARVHAVCEDYRAGATIDRQLDEADLAAGRKIACPTLRAVGSDYLGRGGATPLEVWRSWCTERDGRRRRLRPLPGRGEPARIRWPRWCRSSQPMRTRNDAVDRGHSPIVPERSRHAGEARDAGDSRLTAGLPPPLTLPASGRGTAGAAMKPTGKALQVRKPTLPVARPTIALALGGGGARGLAHILMLEVFDELGLKPTVIAGTSIGAMFGAAYASGLSARLIRAHTEEVLSQRFGIARQLLVGAGPSRCSSSSTSCRSAPSLLKPELLLDHLLPSKVARDFAHLAIPLKVVATDFYAQEQVVIDEGALRSAVAASIALPALFTPVTRDGRLLMDGGLVNPLPFDVLDGAADITVAIDVSGASTRPRQARRSPPPSPR